MGFDERWLIEHGRDLEGNILSAEQKEALSGKKPKRSKYNAKKTPYNGDTYDSKAEAEYAQQLDLEKKAGAVTWWARQVPFRLYGDELYYADFVVSRCHPVYALQVVDKKGVKTATYKRKKKVLKELYNIDIVEV